MMEEELKQKNELKKNGVWAPVTPQKPKSTGNNDPYVDGDQNYGVDREKFSDPTNRANREHNTSKTPKKRKRMKRHRPKIFDETKTMKWNVPNPSTPKQKTPRRRTSQLERRKHVNRNSLKTSVDQSKVVDHASTSGYTEYVKTSCNKKLDFDETGVNLNINHISLSKLVEMLLPTEKQRRSVVDDPLAFKCVLNLRPLAKIRKSRSRGHDLLNLFSIVKRKRSKTFTRCRGKFPLGSSETNKTETYVQVQNDAEKDLSEGRELVNDHLVHSDETIVQAQVDRNGNAMANDLIKEPKLAYNNYVHGEEIIQKCLPNLVPDNVFSRNRIIKTCPPKYSMKLIPRSVPPNLEKEYVLSNRDVAYVEDLIQKFACLCIGENGSQIVVRDEKIHAALVPFKGTVKKRKQWPKVHLDAETIRVWNQMENSKGKENIEEDEYGKTEYWAKEIEMIRRRVERFIKVMNLVLGDRRFSKWNGSTVSSIVGVFLTQNVSDHLSSSAYMYLRAAYPAIFVNTNSSLESTASAHPINTNSSQESTTSVHSVNNNSKNLFEITKSSQESTESTEPDFLKSQIEDTIIVENETIRESQESVILGKFPPHSFNTRIGIEHDNGKKQNRDELRKKYQKDQTTYTTNSVNWEGVRQAPVEDVAKVIESRGMNNIIAGRIKDFLDRIVKDHGSIDLEWLKSASSDETKDYLLSITGLGLKSVECVRLLALHQHAFPVDTNVGRILVRLGWVPLKPLPEDVPFHLLNQYPNLDAIQKYIWPRLANLDVLTLYELHYQLITAGKIFCTKKQPNCNACPLRGECKHFASAFAWSKLQLQASHGEKNEESPAAHTEDPQIKITPQLVPDSIISESGNCEPVIEMPPSPELEPSEMQFLDRDIEDFGCESEDGIPIIKLNGERFNQTVQSIMESIGSFQGKYDMSKALQCMEITGEIDISALVLSSDLASSQKHEDKKRSVYDVYELPDSHPLLEGFEKRDPDDSVPYLLLISKAGDAKTSSPQSRKLNDWQKSTTCHSGTCGSGHCLRCQNDISIHGTILIPCRTANRGEFPLNGTYFQVNEVFADHETSRCPIPVPREMIWNLKKWLLFCGNSVTSICKGMTTRGVQHCFWEGFICVRGFDREKRIPKMLSRRFHIHSSTPVDYD